MSANAVALNESEPILYPSSDGQPLAENTEQAHWIVSLFENLEALYADQPTVLVAANNIWYPRAGRPHVSRAPDVSVVFGRPKGKRLSYQQWLEEDTPLTVVFEVCTPENDDEKTEMLLFYERFGVEEYYLYDPEIDWLEIFIRNERTELLRQHHPKTEFVSPRLRIRFDLVTGEELIVRYPDGRPFVRLKDERKRADDAEQQLGRLKELFRKFRRDHAMPDEIEELDQLEEANET